MCSYRCDCEHGKVKSGRKWKICPKCKGKEIIVRPLTLHEKKVKAIDEKYDAKAKVYEDIYEKKCDDAGKQIDKIISQINKLNGKLEVARAKYFKKRRILWKQMKIAQNPIWDEKHEELDALRKKENS